MIVALLVCPHIIYKTDRQDGEKMRTLAYKYYCEGWGCGQSIIKAADTKYSIDLKGELLKAVSAAGNGFGYGGLCAAPAAAILLFGYIFDENTAKRLRIMFLNEFSMKYDSFNCCSLAGSCGCENVIMDAADIADRLISAEMLL